MVSHGPPDGGNHGTVKSVARSLYDREAAFVRQLNSPLDAFHSPALHVSSTVTSSQSRFESIPPATRELPLFGTPHGHTGQSILFHLHSPSYLHSFVKYAPTREHQLSIGPGGTTITTIISGNRTTQNFFFFIFVFSKTFFTFFDVFFFVLFFSFFF